MLGMMKELFSYKLNSCKILYNNLWALEWVVKSKCA